MVASVSLLVAALAVWRLSAWLWYETGAESVRAFLFKWPWAGRQVACFWCVTLWMSLPVSLLWWLAWPVLIPFALSGAAILLSGGGRIIWRETVESDSGVIHDPRTGGGE